MQFACVVCAIALEEQLEQIEGAYVVGKAAPRVPGISERMFPNNRFLFRCLMHEAVCIGGSACSAGGEKLAMCCALWAFRNRSRKVRCASRFLWIPRKKMETPRPLQCTKSPCRSSGKTSAPAVSQNGGMEPMKKDNMAKSKGRVLVAMERRRRFERDGVSAAEPRLRMHRRYHEAVQQRCH